MMSGICYSFLGALAALAKARKIGLNEAPRAAREVLDLCLEIWPMRPRAACMARAARARSFMAQRMRSFFHQSTLW
jgi:hypothetical protein